MATCYFMHRWLLKRNQKRLDTLNSAFFGRAGKSRDVYTLSLRLQLDENIWCLKQISTGNYIYFAAVISSGLLIVGPPMFRYDKDTMWMLQSFVTFTNMGIPICCLLVIISISLTLDRFRVLILPQRLLDRIEMNKKNRIIEETPRRRVHRVEEEANLYFSHLSDVWECDMRVHM
ncbi:hypothetical protein PFISCL1PPCAC_17177 [Pristionchus fissidentatus]|uniref:G protein-coupled receptor n=1 Tax=Pristionchus fissidentatus TaxID=1538716 RepID=A0AAV5W232_9BILA|nr:hypothetical protein PFISCL1PPCAC_17177 [Pristionchus fissidentatus]